VDLRCRRPSMVRDLAYSQDSRYPDGSQRVTTRGSLRRRRAFMDLVSVVLVLTLASWLLFAGRLRASRRPSGFLLHATSGSQLRGHCSTCRANRQSPTTSVSRGQQLQDADPRVYSELTDASRPQLSTTNGLPTYTWQYVERRHGVRRASTRSQSRSTRAGRHGPGRDRREVSLGPCPSGPNPTGRRFRSRPVGHHRSTSFIERCTINVN